MNGKIYMIYSAGSKKIYIGSTITSLSSRWAKHKYDFLHNLSCSSKELMNECGLENCRILLLYNYPCETKEQLLREEGRQQKLNDCVNKYRAGRSRAEYGRMYYQENKERIKEEMRQYSRLYYEKNKEAQKLKMRLKYQKNRLNNLGAKPEDSLTSGSSDF